MNTKLINPKIQKLQKAILSLVVILFVNVASAFAGNLDAIKAGFKDANSQTISKYLAGNVDITFLDQKSTVSAVQAELVISNFFSKNNVSSFDIKFTGSDSNNNEYAIGEYVSNNGTYSIYITLNGAKEIAELKFEKK